MPSFKAFAAENQNKQQLQSSKIGNNTSATAPAKRQAAAESTPPFQAAAAPSAAAPVAAVARPAPTAAAAANENDSGDVVKMDEDLKVGMSVQICHLQARPELNGLEGVLTSFDAQRSRWKVELKNGSGAKLFKPNNIERCHNEDDALKALRARISKTTPPPNQQRPSGRSAPVQTTPGGQGNTNVVADPAEIVAAGKVNDDVTIWPQENDDDEGFIKSIEMCLKECDVMWDDY